MVHPLLTRQRLVLYLLLGLSLVFYLRQRPPGLPPELGLILEHQADLSWLDQNFQQKQIWLQPLGSCPVELQNELRKRWTGRGWTVTVLPEAPLPAEAWVADRRRHRAERLLVWLANHSKPVERPLLAITSGDISTTLRGHPDWGIFGLASRLTGTAVISSFRLRGTPPAPERLAERFDRISRHEVCHLAGLPHCPNPGCTVHDAEGKLATIDAITDLCPDCSKRVPVMAGP